MLIDTDKYVDATTAAQMLGVTTRRVSALIKARRFEDTVRVGHTRLISRSEVENFRRLPPGVKTRRKQVEDVIKKTLKELGVSTGEEGVTLTHVDTD